MNSLYETDYHQWLSQQREHLIQGQLDQLDVENLIEELEVGIKDHIRELKRHLINLLLHVLKWDYQEKVLKDPWVDVYVKHIWLPSIRNALRAIELLIEQNPCLKPQTDNVLKSAYPAAKRDAIDEMNKYARHENQKLNQNSFPGECPWNFEQVIEYSQSVLK
ncbi:DUF29 domain-containing protein [Endozoicomonas sp. 4G]|uniref:DUF29 domain-containing protein n=1 Tax=Endozoicomonas sp. 4G TaxID=2872754 RepID=UPI002078D6BC|nr:DUF29 domain-containing protein [Endozoicomonas sp. 4G]